MDLVVLLLSLVVHAPCPYHCHGAQISLSSASINFAGSCLPHTFIHLYADVFFKQTLKQILYLVYELTVSNLHSLSSHLYTRIILLKS